MMATLEKSTAPPSCPDTCSVGYDSDNTKGDGSSPGSQASSTPAPHSFSFPEGLVRAVETGVLSLKLSPQGEGGTYFVVSDVPGESPFAVFKPACEEIGTSSNPHGNETVDKEGFVAGEGFKCEELAFLLDHDRFAGIPETRVVTLHGKEGSLMKFIPGCIESWNTTPGGFPASDVHRIAIFDLRVLNCDRHGGNILVSGDKKSLVPIDHSYILPHGWSDPEFEWMEWPQAKLPFTTDELLYISSLDGEQDQQTVTDAIGEESGEVIAVATQLLKIAAPLGYSPKQIAEFCRRQTLTQPSGLELLMADCRDANWDLDMDEAIARIKEAFPPK